MVEFLFSQYGEYATVDIVLEIIAVLFGLISVFFALKNNILVYPTGLVSTIIYVYLLNKWGLIGDMLINGYYTSMSIYGWFLWTRKNDNQVEYPISWANKKEWINTFVIFIVAISTTYFEVFYSWAKVQMQSIFGNILKEFWNRAVVLILLISVFFDFLTKPQFIYCLTGAYVIRAIIISVFFFISKSFCTESV